MSKVSVVKVVGPLAAYAAGFGRELKNRGYTDLSVAQQLRLVAHLSRWLDAEGLEVAGLTPERIEGFCTARRGEGYTNLRTPRALRPLQGFLESHGVVPPLQASQPASAEQLLLDRYRNYLVTERGMVEQGVLRWVHAAERFMAEHPGLADGTTELEAAGVSAFCARELPQRAGSSAKNLAAALRSFLKFLHVEGLLAAPLAQAVPPVAGSVGAGLPRAVSRSTLTALLASCDRRTTKGRRDYAIIVLLARLGLRAGEVARLSLDDIDWVAGEVLVHGKGGRDEGLPLPDDVGTALAGYLKRGRPRAETRAVFLLPGDRPCGGVDPGGSHLGRLHRKRAGRSAQGGGAPASSWLRNRDACCRGFIGRDRSGPPTCRRRHDGDLRQGRLRCPASVGPTLAPRCGMSEHTLERALTDYLAVRRSLGFKLARDGLLLSQFVAFCEQTGADRITSEVALAWVTTPAKASPSWLNMRLSMVSGFARWLQASDPSTEVPPRGWLPPVRRTIPYLYSEADIVALMAAAEGSRWPLSAATYETLVGLLAVTGLRIGEAIRLDRADVSLADGLLTIRESKFGKSRQVPIHPSTVEKLRSYLRCRSALSPTPGEPSFFVHPAGNRINYVAVQQMFRRIAQRAGLTPRSEHCRPTIHGLRHTFAVNTLLRWYRDGDDVQAKLSLLSTWLGHADPKWTYWYLSATPELLTLAAQRLEDSLGRLP